MHSPLRLVGNNVAKTGTPNIKWYIGTTTESPINQWFLPEEQRNVSPSIARPNTKVEERGQLFDITIPYIKHLSIDELARVLDDEEDYTQALRASLKATVREATKDLKSTPEPIYDILNPKLERLERRFRKVCTMNALKMGGAALGASMLGLTAFATTGVMAALTAAAGTGGIAYALKEVSGYVSDISEFKDDGLFLL